MQTVSVDSVGVVQNSGLWSSKNVRESNILGSSILKRENLHVVTLQDLLVLQNLFISN